MENLTRAIAIFALLYYVVHSSSGDRIIDNDYTRHLHRELEKILKI